MRTLLATFLIFAAVAATPVLAAPDEPSVEKYLLDGKLADGEKALSEAVNAKPADAQARFSLGVIQFVGAVERMVQSFHRYGLRSGLVGNALPFARLPIPGTPAPEPIRYADLRALFQRWTDDLAKAEATLAKVDSPDVKLPLHFGLNRIDLNGIESALVGLTPAPPRGNRDRLLFAAGKSAGLRFWRPAACGLALTCLALTVVTLAQSPRESLLGVAVMASGVPAFLWWKRRAATAG